MFVGGRLRVFGIFVGCCCVSVVDASWLAGTEKEQWSDTPFHAMRVPHTIFPHTNALHHILHDISIYACIEYMIPILLLFPLYESASSTSIDWMVWTQISNRIEFDPTQPNPTQPNLTTPSINSMTHFRSTKEGLQHTPIHITTYHSEREWNS